MQILARLRWVTVRVLLRVARGGARERPRQRGERRRPLFVRRVQLGPDVAFERAHAGEVQVEVARPLAEPLRELAKVLGDLRAGVGRIDALAFEVLRDVLDALRLTLGLGPDLGIALDDEVLRVRQQQGGHDEDRGDQGDHGRSGREARPEQIGPDRGQRVGGVAALPAHESALGRHEVEVRAAGIDRLVVGLAGCGGRRHRRRERERAREPVTGATLGVDGDRRLADRRPDPDRRDEQRKQSEDRDGGRVEHRGTGSGRAAGAPPRRARPPRCRPRPATPAGRCAGTTAGADAGRDPTGSAPASGPSAPPRRAPDRPGRRSAQQARGSDGAGDPGGRTNDASASGLTPCGPAARTWQAESPAPGRRDQLDGQDDEDQ